MHNVPHLVVFGHHVKLSCLLVPSLALRILDKEALLLCPTFNLLTCINTSLHPSSRSELHFALSFQLEICGGRVRAILEKVNNDLVLRNLGLSGKILEEAPSVQDTQATGIIASTKRNPTICSVCEVGAEWATNEIVIATGNMDSAGPKSSLNTLIAHCHQAGI